MTLTLIDTFGFFFRSFYALPPLKSRSGHPTGLLTGFINFISTLAKEHGTDYLVFCVDSKTPSYRYDLFPEYKANRPEVPEDLRLQIPVAIEWIQKMGFPVMMCDGWEADDVIASLSARAKEQGIKVRIVSHDKDLYQLIDDGRVVVWDPMKKREVSTQECLEKYEVSPVQFIDYQALIGDSADNVPGVKGIGPKTAAKLLKDYGTLEGIYEALETITPKGVQEKLTIDRERAFVSRKLVTLATGVIAQFDFATACFPEHNPIEQIQEELLALDMGGTLSKSKGATKASPFVRKTESSQPSTAVLAPHPFEAVTLDTIHKLQSILATIPDGSVIAFDTETDDLDTQKASLVGFSFSWDGACGYYVPCGHNYLGVEEQVSLDDCGSAIAFLFRFPIVGHNLKFDLALIERLWEITPATLVGDTMIMGWLDDPSQSVGLDAMAHTYLGHTMITFAQTVKKGATFDTVAIPQATRYAAEDAVMTKRLYEVLLTRLPEVLREEMLTTELPFVATLIAMERRGIVIDIDHFGALGTQLTLALEELTKEIWAYAGGEFNINSPIQLGGVLFEKLGLPTKKKTKTGYSTDEKVLTELSSAHPIVEKLLEYRELFKLKSTYIEPLSALARQKPDHRITTSFLQTGTATGRLASRNPNLQNIPVRSEWGRRVREGFVAADGFCLVGIDYSQIELRLLAHFSQDPVLIDAFMSDRDIHTETARRLFGDDKAQEKRSLAKTINFGILYGMGSRKLADDLSISTKEAKEIIEAYFASFPTIRTYLETIRRQAKEEGFVQTLLGRRRKFDFASATPMLEAAYLREAVNTVFQGTAADIIKLAMNAIEQSSLDVSMLLQIHDELIFEVPANDAIEVSQTLASMMESIVTLHVPLKTSIQIGHCWGELK